MKVLQDLRENWPMATEIHKLETRLWREMQRNQLKVLLVTSAVRGEGKSTMVAYLATALAQHPGRNILAMDLDLRRSTLNTHFDLESDHSMEDLLRGECSIAEAIVHSPLRNGQSGLDLLLPGEGTSDPQVLLNSPKLLEIFLALRPSYDLILVDSPPLIPVADATALIPFSDAVLLTVMAGVTTKHHLTRARELCLGLGANILGIVVGNIQEAAPEYMDSYYFGYYDGNSKQRESKENPRSRPSRPDGRQARARASRRTASEPSVTKEPPEPDAKSESKR